jgi:hypothetical protein
MKRRHVVSLCLVALCASNSLSAQERESGLQSWIDNTGKRLVALFDKPLHPILGGVAAGGGAGGGLEYKMPLSGRWHAEAKGVYTIRKYWSTGLGVGYRGDRATIETYARARDMSRIVYYGQGIESEVANRTNFHMRDRVLGSAASTRVVGWLTLGARVEELWPDVGPGRSPTVPSIEQRFDEGDAPGLTLQPRFGRYEGSLDATVPAALGEALFQGAKYRVTYASFVDQQLDRFSFQRYEVEAQHRFALFGTLRRLTLHGWLSTTQTSAGNEVPFYLQRTLGGHSHLRSPYEDLIGSDGSRGTLRGFSDYRFRDRNLLLLQGEYRMPIWGPVDATVFADAGKVTSRRADLDLDGLRRSYGLSLNVMRGPSTAARVEAGFGGGDGVHLHFTFNRDMP